MIAPSRTESHDLGASSRHIPSLDGLRGVAILLVLVSHAAGTANFPLPEAGMWYAMQGGVGVDVFFVISGFLITTLLLRERDKTGTVSLRGFYARRALRILPAFVFYLGALAVLDRLGWVQLIPRDWIAASTYTVNFFSGIAPPVSHIWSLSVEEHFYLLWPPLLVMLGVRRAAIAALMCLLAEPIIRWITYRYSGGVFDIDYVTFTRVDGIATGCVMAFLARAPGPRPFLRHLDARPAAWFLAGLCTLALSLFVLGHSGKYTIVAKPFVNALAIGVMIWTATRFPATSVGRMLNFEPLAWIGRISYSLYIWQQLFLVGFKGPSWMGEFPQNVGLSLAAAVASYYLNERPYLSFKRRFRTAGVPRAADTSEISGASAQPSEPAEPEDRKGRTNSRNDARSALAARLAAGAGGALSP